MSGERSGAEALLEGLLKAGVEVCFANPGTSEMHFVAALDQHPQMRAVLCLDESVAAGAADGYARVSGIPAATLLHLGPGLANAWSNLHNARRAGTPVVNVVGEHASSHQPLDSPLQSDIQSVASGVSALVTTATEASDLYDLAQQVVADVVNRAAGRGGAVPSRSPKALDGAIGTLIVPADLSWTTNAPTPTRESSRSPEPVVSDDSNEAATLYVKGLQVGSTALILGPAAATPAALEYADRIRSATGAQVYAETFIACRSNGAHLPDVRELPYRAADARAVLANAQTVLLLGAREPVASFAYPDAIGTVLPPAARVLRVPARAAENLLRQIATTVAADVSPTTSTPIRYRAKDAPLTVASWPWALASALPENSIVCDESITSGMVSLGAALAHAPAHQSLGLTGLSIGLGIPLSTGAAIAAPDRAVIDLQADGSAMYTITGLWTQAREQLNVTTVILDNSAYAILREELNHVGKSESTASKNLFSLSKPSIDFVAVASGMGVPGLRVTTEAGLVQAMEMSKEVVGPFLIQASLS